MDIVHPLTWERAERVCSSRILKVEEKILVRGGSRALLVYRDRWLCESLALKRYGTAVVYSRFGKPKRAKMLFQVPGPVTWGPQSVGVGTTSPGWSNVILQEADILVP